MFKKKLLGLASDSAIYGLSSSLSRLVGLIMLPVLGGFLTKAEFGVMFVLSIVSLLFAPLANLGMTNAVFRRFNQQKDPGYRARVLSTGLVSILVSSTILLIVTQIFAESIAKAVVGEASATPLVRITLVTATFNSISVIFIVALRAARRVKTAATMILLKVVVYFAATVVLVVGFDLGLKGVVLGSLIGEVCVGAAQLLVTFREFRSPPERHLWREMIAYGLPFAPHQLQAVGLELFGIYMVRELLGLEAAGLYGVASRFASPVTLIVNSVQTSWVPYKFHIHAEDTNPEAFFQSALVYYLAGLSYLWMGVSLWGPELLRVIMPDQFEPAGLLIWATALIPALHGVYFMAGTGFELQNKTRSMPLVSFLGLATVIAAAFALTSSLGALGAALASALAWLVMSVTIYVLSQRRFPINYDWATIGAFVTLAAAFVVAGRAIQSQPVLVRVGTAILFSVAYPVMCTLILLRSRDERPRVRQLLSKLRLA